MSNDADFWHSAYRSHAPAVLAFLRRRVGHDEAEDVLQETFVRAIRADTFHGDGNARAYLMSTARHLLINRLRRPRLVVPADELAPRGDDPAGDPMERVAAADDSPEDDAAWSAFRQRLRDALDQLPEHHRRAFELAALEGQSYAEVAAATGWSLPQVKINVYRARRRLVEGLADYLPRRT